MAVNLDSLENAKASAPPPRTGQGRRSNAATRAATAVNASKNQARREALEGLGTIAQAGLMMAGQMADAATIPRHWPNVAQEAANLADSNEGVAKGIDYLLTVGPYAGLLTAALPMVLQFLANHRRIPAHALAGAGVVPPEALEAEMMAGIARMQADAIRAQQEAEASLADLQSAAAPNGQAPS